MKKENYARVRYEKDTDSFVLELFDHETEEYEFSVSARCFKAEHGGENADYIHFSFMKEIVKCCELGYQVHFFKGV